MTPAVARRVVIGLLAAGVGLRLAAWVHPRDLWGDEAMLALNVVARSPAGLAAPLDRHQGAPVGFLLLVKAATAAFGDATVALRLVPFLGSLAGLVGFAAVAPRLVPRPAAVLAVALVAGSPHLVSYAGECKQYSTDAAVAVLLLAVWRAGPRWVLAGAGAAAVWLSHPAAFVLGGLGLAVLADRRTRSSAVPVGLCWAASFAGCYVVSLRHLGGDGYLLAYWDGLFVPRSASAGPWLVERAVGFFAAPGGFGPGLSVLAGLLAVAGGVALWRDDRPLVLAVAAPAGFALLAAAVHKYPFGGRLLLFLVPAACLLVARGAWHLAERLPRPTAALLVLTLTVVPPVQAVRELRTPPRWEQLSEVLSAVRAGWQPGDRVYVYYGAEPAFAWQTRHDPFPDGSVTLGRGHRADPAGYTAEVRNLPPGRVWLVFAHRHADEEGRVATAAGAALVAAAPGAAAYLRE